MNSWKTTALGILGLIAAVSLAGTALLDGDPSTVPNWEAIMAALSAAGIGFFARDNDKSSESVGAK